MQHKVGDLMRVPLQVRPPVDQDSYERRPGVSCSLGGMQSAEAAVGLDDYKVGPLTQPVAGPAVDGLEDERAPSGHAGFLKGRLVPSVHIHQRYPHGTARSPLPPHSVSSFPIGAVSCITPINACSTSLLRPPRSLVQQQPWDP